MSHPELDNLVRIGKLKTQPPAAEEISGLLASAEARLDDAERDDLSSESRFDLAYNAAHAFALAALRWHGYRAENRYLVFQAVQHTAPVDPAHWRVLSEAHRKRNLIEYEGVADIGDEMLAALLRATRELAAVVRRLGPVG